MSKYLLLCKPTLSVHAQTHHHSLDCRHTAYSDSDWVGNPDDCHSTTGYAFLLDPCLISLSANKKLVVSKSSTEAEYKSLAMDIVELYWFCMLFKELHIPIDFPLTLWCDNLSALALASNPMLHTRSKHIEVDYDLIKEKLVAKDILTRYLPTLE